MHWNEPYWDDRNSDKIAARATQDEVEAVLFDPATLTERVRSDDPDYRRYSCLGLTDEGRYLFVIAQDMGNGVVRPISARDMEDSERGRFKSRGK